MGCGNSKNQIHVVSTTTDNVDNTVGDKLTEKPPRVKGSRPASNTTQARNRSAGARSRRSAWDGSTESVGDERSLANDLRGGSATSKASKHSCDSGFDDEGYNKVITEASDPEKIKQIEQQFETPRELELGVIGQACPQRLSAKDKERLEEQRILATLQQEGLITRPMSRAAFGVSFEVVEAPTADARFLTRRPPARLAKLEKRKKKKELTEEELQAKMARAEERRKAREQQRLAKIQAVTMKSDISNALSTQTAHQETVKIETKAKVEQALENREKRLEELREKLRRKEEHAEMVRKRRALAPIEPDDEEQAELLRSRNFTEDTPIEVTKHN